MKDYYRILEVHPEASAEVLTRAYRTLVQKYHPDRYHSSDKTRMNAQMQDLNEAYETLSNETRRRRYNKQWQSHEAGRPGREKAEQHSETRRKLVYGFLLAIFLAFVIRGGVQAAMANPVVKWGMLAGLVWIVYGLFSRKDLRQ